MSSMRKLPDNSLDGFRFGACLDLRVRLAMQLLEHSPMFAPGPGVGVAVREGQALQQARHALDVATELLALAEERGLVETLGGDGDEERLEAHAKRNARFQTAGQLEAQKLAKDAAAGTIAVRQAMNG